MDGTHDKFYQAIKCHVEHSFPIYRFYYSLFDKTGRSRSHRVWKDSCTNFLRKSTRFAPKRGSFSCPKWPHGLNVNLSPDGNALSPKKNEQELFFFRSERRYSQSVLNTVMTEDKSKLSSVDVLQRRYKSWNRFLLVAFYNLSFRGCWGC